jgi:hypothetical protein
VLAVILMATTLSVGLTVALNETVTEWIAVDHEVRKLELAVQDPTVESKLEALRQKRDLIQSQVASANRRKSVHLLLGVGSALTVVLVSSIAVTYFIGTSRWCREVIETFSLEPELIDRGQALKRRSFPFALASMLTVVVITALGAASDPGTGNIHSAWWTIPHFVAALCGVAIILVCFYVLWNNILSNYELIESVMDRVSEARRERASEN